MLSVFKRLLDKSAAAESQSAPSEKPHQSRPLRHRPELIANLRDQHRELLRLFADLELASERDDAKTCRWALDRFAEALESHLTVENRHLYGYLSRRNHSDPDTAQRIETMSTDMMHVGRILHRFISAYSRTAMTPARIVELRRDLRAIGEVLAHRIHEEETVLYPLYAPPAA